MNMYLFVAEHSGYLFYRRWCITLITHVTYQWKYSKARISLPEREKIIILWGTKHMLVLPSSNNASSKFPIPTMKTKGIRNRSRRKDNHMPGFHVGHKNHKANSVRMCLFDPPTKCDKGANPLSNWSLLSFCDLLFRSIVLFKC